MRILEFCLPHCGIRSAASTTIDFGAIFPFTFVPAYRLPVYASQRPLPVHHARLGTRLLARLYRGRHLRRLNFKRFQGATHTVPCVVQTWLRHQADFPSAVREIIAAGGDTDTTAAILGAIIGARVGEAGIPDEWLRGIIEWPRSVAWIEHLGQAAGRALEGEPGVPSPVYFAPGIIARNAFFLAVVLAHGFRRLLPPY